MEDYAVVYFGSAVFKTMKLLLLAIFSVHIFACLFYRVKDISAASRDEVIDFYASRDVAEDVRTSVPYFLNLFLNTAPALATYLV
jgi:hypothetical protein